MIPFKSIRVGPFDYAITQLEGEDRDRCLGMFSSIQMQIKMRESYQTKQQEAETFLHETIHAVFEVMGIHDKDSQERTTTLLSVGMAMVIRDNGPLFDWLRKQLA